jgi:pimeloyl-ACP methyl ester carboxylesterase
MNFLIRPDAESVLAQDDYRRLWGFFTGMEGAPWLTESVKQQYRDVWDGPQGGPPGAGLRGGCNYYRASPLRPPRPDDPAAAAVTLPREMLTVDLPTLVLWAMDDAALLPTLVDGLDDYIPRLTLERVPGASHWIVHERPAFVAERLTAFLSQPT